MALFSERNGRPRSYSDVDLYSAIITELKSWHVRQLLYRQFGGVIYFDGPSDDDPLEEIQIFEEMENAEAYFRRALRVNLSFDFDSANDFVSNLPYSLNPQRSGDLSLLFDFLEVLYNLVASIHYNPKTKKQTFNKYEGQKAFRNAINPDLALGPVAYTMLTNGQIVEVSQKPVVDLAEQILVIDPSGGITEGTLRPLQNAASNYLARGASIDQKKQAVRDLADALESLRPKIKEELLTKDEQELFKISNQFAIRHNDSKQKGDYDKSIWYDWMFHVNLAALLTVIRILQDKSKED